MTAIRFTTWTFKVNKGQADERTIVVEDVVAAADHPDDVRSDPFMKSRALRQNYGKDKYKTKLDTHHVHRVELGKTIGKTAK